MRVIKSNALYYKKSSLIDILKQKKKKWKTISPRDKMLKKKKSLDNENKENLEPWDHLLKTK